MGWIHPEETQPEVSVIIPVYNRASLIRRALTSLARQDFALPYEVIVVDDGSTDASALVAQQFDPRVQVLRQMNLQAHRARGNGAKAARGRYLAFLDSDDEAKPSHLSAHYATLQRSPEAVLCYGYSEDQFGTPYREGLPMPEPEQPSGLLRAPFRACLECDCFIVGMNIMVQRERFLQIHAGLPDYSYAEDFAFFLHAALQGPFVCSGCVTHVRHLQADSVSISQCLVQSAGALRAVVDTWKSSQYADDPELVPVVRRAVKHFLPRGLAALLVAKEWQEAGKIASYVRYAMSFSVFRNLARHWLWQMGWTRPPPGYVLEVEPAIPLPKAKQAA